MKDFLYIVFFYENSNVHFQKEQKQLCKKWIIIQ